MMNVAAGHVSLVVWQTRYIGLYFLSPSLNLFNYWIVELINAQEKMSETLWTDPRGVCDVSPSQ